MATWRDLAFRFGLAHGQQTAVVSGKGFRERLHGVHPCICARDMISISCLPSRTPQGNGHTFISFLFYFG